MRLIEVDLTKAYRHTHPDVKLKTWYLALYGSIYLCGKFEESWYGLWLKCNYGMSGHLQFDAPDVESSLWRGLWEISDAPENRPD